MFSEGFEWPFECNTPQMARASHRAIYLIQLYFANVETTTLFLSQGYLQAESGVSVIGRSSGRRMSPTNSQHMYVPSKTHEDDQ